YALLGLWAAIMLSIGSLFFDYERVVAAGHIQEHILPANAETVHWGYFSQTLEPKLVIDSGDTVTVETLTHHANADIFQQSSVDGAMRDGFRKMRHFLMTTQGLSEDEAISLMSVAVDFGVTQVVDDNWGVHGAIAKAVLPSA
ncbi:MAG: hypothetical protein AAFO84_14635, partial [Cyanobacteria bacterium J06598_1]